MAVKELAVRSNVQEKQQSPSSAAPKETPQQSPVDLTKHFDKYGYQLPRQAKLKKSKDAIMQAGTRDVLTEALDRSKDDQIDKEGKKLVASIVTQDYVPHLEKWLDAPNSRAPEEKTVRLAVLIDFAKTLEEVDEKRGEEKRRNLREALQERQPKLGGLSSWTAMQRGGKELLGTVHQITQEIARGEVEITNFKQRQKAENIKNDYTLEEGQRGH
jgi:hypothetical protein